MDKQSFKDALSSILTDRPIAYHPTLARAGGGVQAGVFLSQLLYWTPRGKRPDGWIYKSKKEWEEETALTRSEIDRARNDLKERGILQEKLTGVPATLHYRVDMERLAEVLASGYETESIDQPRDEKGKFLPVSGKTANCPSSPQNGQLDSGNTDNKLAETPSTSQPSDGQLSRDVQRSSEILNSASGGTHDAQPEQRTESDDAPSSELVSSETEISARGHATHIRQQDPLERMVGWTRRTDAKPWVHWGNGSVRSRDGIDVDDLRRVGWMIEDQTGLSPVNGEMTGWVKALGMIYEAAEGKWDVIERGVKAVWKRDAKYRPGHARGFVDEVRKAATIKPASNDGWWIPG